MKQKNPIIALREFTADGTPYGTEQGQTAFAKMQKELNKHASSKIIGISFKGIERIDISFSRESVVTLAKSKKGEVGFYLKDLKNKDHIENLRAAAKAKEQPLIVIKDDDSFETIGPELSSDMTELLKFIMEKETVTTSVIVKKFNLSAPNASGKLKKLLNWGLIIGSKEAAESGGLEYIYTAIK